MSSESPQRSELFHTLAIDSAQSLLSDSESSGVEPVESTTEIETLSSSHHLLRTPVVSFNYPPPLLVPPSPPSQSSTSFRHLPSSSTNTNRPATASTPFNDNISQHTHTSNRSQMGKEKEKSRIDIILDSPFVALRGTMGSDVEPAVLSGHVNLFLAEDTDIKEVNLHFRGKARIPVPAYES